MKCSLLAASPADSSSSAPRIQDGASPVAVVDSSLLHDSASQDATSTSSAGTDPQPTNHTNIGLLLAL